MPRRGLAMLLLAFVALALIPFLRRELDFVDFPVFYLAFMATVLFWVAQATSWNILSGYSGYFSFGQGAFFGVGAYTTAVLAGRHGWDFFATLPLAGLLAVLLALIIGAVAFRLRSLRGEIFALLTLAVPFIIAPLIRVNPVLDGGQGVPVPVPAYPEFLGPFRDFVYLVSLAIAAFAVMVAYLAQHSRLGWALFAIRDAEAVAEALGVPTFRYKMLAISLTGFIGGLAGSVFAVQVGYLTVEGVFTLTVPLFVIVMSVLGGRAHWLGPALGALVIVTMRDRLAAGGFEGWSLVILGLVLATLVLLAPEGLMARLRIRPVPTALTFAAVLIALVIYQGWGTPLDWLAVAMAAGAVVAFLPVSQRRISQEEARLVADELISVQEVKPPDEETSTVPQPSRAHKPELGEMVVEAVEVARSFGGVRALQGVSLAIREGELVGLVGPNGSGKTTLVNLISGAFAPSSGTIRLAGRSIQGLAQHRIAHLGVARTYQIPRPFESMSVRDNVAIAIMFGREPRSLEQARKAAAEHLELVGLTRLAAARPAEINLHERQLLEMARALATRPRVLLLDEALAGLNPAEIDNATQVVRRIHQSGVTIVLVEHLLRVVNQLATRIVVLDQGLTLAQGEPSAVMSDPAVIRAYLGRQAAPEGGGASA
jgi:branched-chain amino acid transport system permease protein